MVFLFQLFIWEIRVPTTTPIWNKRYQLLWAYDDLHNPAAGRSIFSGQDEQRQKGS